MGGAGMWGSWGLTSANMRSIRQNIAPAKPLPGQCGLNYNRVALLCQHENLKFGHELGQRNKRSLEEDKLGFPQPSI